MEQVINKGIVIAPESPYKLSQSLLNKNSGNNLLIQSNHLVFNSLGKRLHSAI